MQHDDFFIFDDAPSLPPFSLVYPLVMHARTLQLNIITTRPTIETAAKQRCSV